MLKTSDALRFNDIDLLVKLCYSNERTMSARDYDVLRSICINNKKNHFLPILDNLQDVLNKY